MVFKKSGGRRTWINAVSRCAFIVVLCSAPLRANVVGVETQNFHPTTSGLDFVTVQSSETLKPGYINTGFFLNYAVNSLPYFDNSQTQTRTHFNDVLLGTDVNFGLGLLPNWDMGISLPAILYQRVSNEGFHGQFASYGNTEVRINTKFRFWGDDNQGIATVISTNINRLKDNPYVGKDPGPTLNVELVGDTTINKFALALNLGYRMRASGKTIDPEANLVRPLKSQMIASTALSYYIEDLDTKLISEIFTSWPQQKIENNSNRAMSSAELLLGAKYNVRHDLAIQSGFGTELQHGLSSPDWRFYAGLNWQIGPTVEKPQPPQKVEPGPPPDLPAEQFVIHDILFEFDSSTLVTRGGLRSLAELADHLKKTPHTRLVVEGHTDSIGSLKYNQKLSFRRATTIRTWLMREYQFDGSKIVAIGKGEIEPIADNGNYQGRQLNRRVVFKIYK